MPSQSTFSCAVTLAVTSCVNGKPPAKIALDLLSEPLIPAPEISASMPATHCGANCQLYPISPPPMNPRGSTLIDWVTAAALAAAVGPASPNGSAVEVSTAEPKVSTVVFDQL